MSLDELIAQLQELADRIGGDIPVYIDGTYMGVAHQVELDHREDVDGEWLALVEGDGVLLS